MVENCKRLFLLIVIFCLSCGISLAASYSDINSISISNSYVTASLNDSMKIEATIKDRYYRNFSKSDVTSIMIAGNIWWESSNKNVVKIEGTDADNGKTIANNKCVGTGTATLRVLSSNRVTASCTINVKENNSPVIGSIRMEKSIENTTVNSTLTINAIIKDNKWNSISKDKIALLMKNGDIWFETSNSRVLSITSTDSKDGQCLAYVKGVSAGTATIYVRSSKGAPSSCIVTVKKSSPVSTPTPTPTPTPIPTPSTVVNQTRTTNGYNSSRDIRGKFEIMPFSCFSCLDLAPKNLGGLHVNPDEIITQIANAKITTVVLKNNIGVEDKWNDDVMDNLIKKFGQKNIKVLVDDYRINALLGDINNATKSYNSSRDKNKLETLLNKYSDYNNVLGFYIFDEPGSNGFQTLSQFTKDINTITKNKKEVYINLFPNYASDDQLKGINSSKEVRSSITTRNYYDNYLLKFVKGGSAVPTSILSVDHYSTYFTDDRGSLLNFYQNLLNVLAASRASNTRMIPMNYVIILDQRIGGEHYRNLNINEIAFQVSANLAFGMKRLGYYACITASNGIAVSNTALFDYNSNHSSESSPGTRKSPTTKHYDMVSDINNKWAYNLGTELYKKDLQNIYELSNKNLLNKYTTSSPEYYNIGRISNSIDGLIIATFDDKSFLLVNTNFTNNNVISFDNLSNYSYFDYTSNTWKRANNVSFSYSGKNDYKTFATIALNNNTITLAPGHCILLKGGNRSISNNTTFRTIIETALPLLTGNTIALTTDKPWIKASEWAEIELNRANELELIPEIFNKEDLTANITRKEFAHVAVKLYEKITGSLLEPIEVYPFIDTDDVYVLKAYNVGITQGTGSDTFTPDELITREQMATMMTRAIEKAGIDTKVDLDNMSKFADDNEMHDWGRESIYYMSSIEVIKGVGDNTFSVLGNATREQSLLISVRSAEKFNKLVK